ncbi:MAG: FAD-dependent oxidoreductase [Candidatus Krumholzibacteriia bacterium]|nr:FAD-dependent oxidoreductase [bacterium]MCB9514271.1 FAD-dependent oxidoreductase [Candidatus Latescibacterota bacterium]MCB9516712.1 FAD-dependent oxidoreductase [Candidatus Latescibacterota bacterium]
MGRPLFLVLTLLAGLAQRATPATVLDVQCLSLVHVAESAPPDSIAVDVYIAGGGLGGCAAALAACDAGLRVLLSEETRWLGGQATAEGVSALDENYWVETSGATRSYQRFRALIRDHYRPLCRATPPPARLNPGNCWASALAFEPAVGVAALDSLLAPHCASGALSILRRWKPYRAEVAGARVVAVDLVQLDSAARCRVRSAYYLDATALGDLLPLVGAHYTVGAESRNVTGEPSAPALADSRCEAAFTYPFVVEARPGESRPWPAPPDYARVVADAGFDDPWPLPLGSASGDAGPPTLHATLPGAPGSLWTYRRLIDATQFDPAAHACALTLVNWPTMDYRGGGLLSADPEQQLAALREAKALSLAFFHWMQTAMPRADGGVGHPELRLLIAAMGSDDGLALHPYVRESRRLAAWTTLREQDVAKALLPGRRRGRFFRDAVAIGHYGLDLHPGPCAETISSEATRPFQIPLVALVPERIENLLAAGRCLGVTHITASCTRLHPIEWAIGEAAGAAAAECVASDLAPRALLADPAALLRMQRRLVSRGAPIVWYADLATDDPRFQEAQLAPFVGADGDSLLELSSNYDSEAWQ